MSLLPAVASLSCTLVVACSMVSCHRLQSGSGPLIADYASLKPDQVQPGKCALDLAGTRYTAELKTHIEGRDLQIDLVAFGSTVDSERYRTTDQAFSLVEGGGERYDPPIELVKYPMHIGDKWDWTGKIMTGPVSHDTTATITTSSENLTLKGETLHDVLRADVDLSIDSGRPDTPAHRRLSFWIAPNKGVIKRKFGDYSTRSPLEE